MDPDWSCGEGQDLNIKDNKLQLPIGMVNKQPLFKVEKLPQDIYCLLPVTS